MPLRAITQNALLRPKSVPHAPCYAVALGERNFCVDLNSHADEAVEAGFCSIDNRDCNYADEWTSRHHI
jgi:hypothetical protein